MSGEGLPRVLCVDDEPNVLEALARTLRKRFAVTTAVGANAGLCAVEAQGPFQVVVSDLRMPGADGVTFLNWVRQVAPDTVRVLLTGGADVHSAMAAVNEGAVFRFLAKPCPPDALLQTLDEAAAHYRLVTSERAILEQTVHGSIKALTDILALVNPAGFGRATRAKRLVGELAAALRLPSCWEVEVAAMLSQIGSITLPADTVERLYRGAELTEPEAQAVRHLPAIASEVVANIPRLEEVRDILAWHGLRFDGVDSPHDAPRAEEIPIGARVLRVALDYDLAETRGAAAAAAVRELQARAGWYDPAVLDALSRVHGDGSRQRPAVRVGLRSLRPGMIFAQDVKTATGVLLIARGQEVSERLVERARNLAPLGPAEEQVYMHVPDGLDAVT